jgi:hypothetical protein
MGKTSFAIRALLAAILKTEDGFPQTAGVVSMPAAGCIQSWRNPKLPSVLGALHALLTQDHDRKTVCVDVVNKAATLCRQHVCDEKYAGNWQRYNQWGEGDRVASDEFVRMLHMLDRLRTERNMLVILNTHEGLIRQGNAEGDDHWKIGGAFPGKQFWPLIHEWADQVGRLSMRPTTVVTKDGDKIGKVVGKAKDNRIMTFLGGADLDVKARVGYEMPAVVKDFNWDAYVALNQAWYLPWAGQSAEVSEVLVQEAV